MDFWKVALRIALEFDPSLLKNKAKLRAMLKRIEALCAFEHAANRIADDADLADVMQAFVTQGVNVAALKACADIAHEAARSLPR